MTFDELVAALTPTAGTVEANIGIFGDSGFAAFFDEANLVIDEASDPEAVEATVMVEGTLSTSYLDQTDPPPSTHAIITAWVEDDQAEAEIELTFPDGLKLGELLDLPGFAVLAADLTPAVREGLVAPLASITLDSVLSAIRVVADLDRPIDLAEVPHYLQGADVVAQFPSVDGFPSFETGVEARSFEIWARLDPALLVAVQMGLGLVDGSTWQPLDDLITFTDLGARILVGSPLDGPVATVDIACRATVAGEAMEAVVQLPDLDFEFGLAEGEIALVSLFEALVDVPLPFDEITCDRFAVSGAPSIGRYDFSARVKGDWLLVGNGATALSVEELGLDMTLLTGADRSVGARFSGVLRIGTLDFAVSASSEAGQSGWAFQGRLLPPEAGQTAAGTDGFFDALIGRFGIGGVQVVADAKDLLGNAKIEQLDVSVHSQTGDFAFFCATSFELDGEAVELELTVDLVNPVSGGYTVDIGGDLLIGHRRLQLDFGRTIDPEAGNGIRLAADYRNDVGEEIDLVSGVIEAVSQAPSPATDLGLTAIVLYHLRLSHSSYDSPKTKTFGLQAHLRWKPVISWPALENLIGGPITPTIDAVIDLEKQVGGTAATKLTGTVSGELGLGVDGLEFLTLGLRYELKENGDEVRIELGVGDVAFRAVKEEKVEEQQEDAATQSLVFTVDAGQLTLGDVVSFVASLLDPSIDQLHFDEPWTFFTDFELSDLLDHVTLTIERTRSGGRTTRTVTVTVGADALVSLVPEVLEPFLTISSLSLEYRQESPPEPGKPERSTRIIPGGNFLGQAMVPDTDPVPGWDPVNETPPEIPGRGPAIDLRYLAIGQHVAITGATEADNIAEVMSGLRDAAEDRQTELGENRPATADPIAGFGAGGPVAFSADSNWLIGLDIGLLGIVDVTLIFNDPLIYGLRLELRGEAVKKFAGLQFEILYQRINDTVGRYHAELVLPDVIRHLQLGAVSITLPIIVVDVYTNGDFKIDFGFPWRGDFSRSAGMEVLPFVGAGGFYLNKLSAVTASGATTPRPTVPGTFTPIYEFGLGLKIGVGKSFTSGPLNAEISITIQGIVEGVVSWFQHALPVDSTAEVDENRYLFYRVGGAVSIVARVYGAVDFAIIRVSVEVVARATIAFQLESYAPIEIALTAQVKVKASVEVLFITVDLEFEMTVRQRFTLPTSDEGTPPWLKA